MPPPARSNDVALHVQAHTVKTAEDASKVPTELVQRHINNVKTGVRGVAYLRLEPNPPDWPDSLATVIPDDLSTIVVD